MSVGAHDQTCLDALLTEFTTGIPTALDDIDADGGPTLADPISYVVVDDMETELFDFPALALTVDGGSSPQTDWLTQQRDSEIPLLAAIVLHPADDKQTISDRDARHYARALDVCLTRRFQNVSGLWFVDVEDLGLEQFGADKNRRRAFIRARLMYRTSRELT